MPLRAAPTLSVAPDLDVDLALVLQVQDLALTLSAVLTEIERGRLRDVGPVHDTILQMRARLDRLGTELTIRNFRYYVDHVVMPIAAASELAFEQAPSDPEPPEPIDVEMPQRRRQPSRATGVRLPYRSFTRDQLLKVWAESDQTRGGFAAKLGIGINSVWHHLNKHNLMIEVLDGRRVGPSILRDLA